MDNIVHIYNITVTSNKIKNKNNKPANIKLYYQKREPFIQINNLRMIAPLFIFESISKNEMEKY